MYSESLGRWRTADLLIGLAYLARTEGQEHPVADIAAKAQPVGLQRDDAPEQADVLVWHNYTLVLLPLACYAELAAPSSVCCKVGCHLLLKNTSKVLCITLCPVRQAMSVGMLLSTNMLLWCDLLRKSAGRNAADSEVHGVLPSLKGTPCCRPAGCLQLLGHPYAVLPACNTGPVLQRSMFDATASLLAGC